MLFVTHGSNAEDIKQYFDYSQNALEYGYISDEVCYAIYIISDDYYTYFTDSIHIVFSVIMSSYGSVPPMRYKKHPFGVLFALMGRT